MTAIAGGLLEAWLWACDTHTILIPPALAAGALLALAWRRLADRRRDRLDARAAERAARTLADRRADQAALDEMRRLGDQLNDAPLIQTRPAPADAASRALDDLYHQPPAARRNTQPRKENQ